MKDDVNSFGQSLYVGCGEDRRDGFLHCDTRALDGVDIVCKAWEVSQYRKGLKEIYSRHMLEHLTSMEAEAALHDWHNALALDGTVYIVVPNLDYHVRQWLEAEWNEDTLRDKTSDARFGFAGLYGWQRECDPRSKDYNDSHWDVHKSGYNEKRLKFLLERAGFVDVHTEVKGDVHLVATGRKSMNKGERQISTNYRNIRQDHKNRYAFAVAALRAAAPAEVLDLACGIGYGSLMLAELEGTNVTAVDIDSGAIDYAKRYYQADNIHYVCEDARNLDKQKRFDAIVSFETIEHVEFDQELINTFFDVLNPGGTFICSTPNQDVMPFDKDKFRFHIRHYTVSEISQIAQQAGFTVEEVLTQKDSVSGPVEKGDDGSFTILVCKK